MFKMGPGEINSSLSCFSDDEEDDEDESEIFLSFYLLLYSLSSRS
jgi:hypothetical protein